MRIVTKVRMKRRMLLTVFSLGILMIAIVGISLATKNLIFADSCQSPDGDHDWSAWLPDEPDN